MRKMRMNLLWKQRRRIGIPSVHKLALPRVLLMKGGRGALYFARRNGYSASYISFLPPSVAPDPSAALSAGSLLIQEGEAISRPKLNKGIYLWKQIQYCQRIKAPSSFTLRRWRLCENEMVIPSFICQTVSTSFSQRIRDGWKCEQQLQKTSSQPATEAKELFNII